MGCEIYRSLSSGIELGLRIIEFAKALSLTLKDSPVLEKVYDNHERPRERERERDETFVVCLGFDP